MSQFPAGSTLQIMQIKLIVIVIIIKIFDFFHMVTFRRQLFSDAYSAANVQLSITYWTSRSAAPILTPYLQTCQKVEVHGPNAPGSSSWIYNTLALTKDSANQSCSNALWGSKNRLAILLLPRTWTQVNMGGGNHFTDMDNETIGFQKETHQRSGTSLHLFISLFKKRIAIPYLIEIVL